MHPISTTGLYWSLRGEIACESHAPDVEDPSWIAEGWQAIPESSGHVKATRYQCQHCSQDGRAVVHSVPNGSASAAK